MKTLMLKLHCIRLRAFLFMAGFVSQPYELQTFPEFHNKSHCKALR
jgi:hypothetical protein